MTTLTYVRSRFSQLSKPESADQSVLTDLDGNCKLFCLKLILSLAPLIPRAHPDQILEVGVDDDLLEVGFDDDLLEVEIGDVLLEVEVGDVIQLEVVIDDDVFYSLLPC